jgi:PPK2 family polyphosphate:nucleotide phosphotransferase
MNYVEQFRLAPESRVRLREVNAGFKDRHEDKESAQQEVAHYAQRLAELQHLLYAEGRRSLLVCLQAMDAGGKDGTIRHVLGAMNPQGCRVYGFKVPTPEEAAHDFLWRVHRAAPGRGEVAIFNRSHYEDVLVTRVHKLVPPAVWKARYGHINHFERLLTDHGTKVLKFFLHISPEEQLERFRRRLDDPARRWKISEADYRERPYWDAYQAAFEEVFQECSPEHAPWYVIPADHKWFRNLAVSRILVETLEAMDLALPAVTVDLEAIRRAYHAAEAGDENL